MDVDWGGEPITLGLLLLLDCVRGVACFVCRFLESVSFSSDSGGRGGVTYRLTDGGRKFLRNDKVCLGLTSFCACFAS